MTATSPASMGGPLSEAEREHGIDIDWGYEALGCKCAAAFVENDIEALSLHLQDVARAESDARVRVLEGQLATARALHRPERRYTPDDGETSYATYSEAADASFDGTGRPAMVTFFEVCSHCASIEMAEGCDHQYKESLWPCKEAVALGLDGGDPDA